MPQELSQSAPDTAAASPLQAFEVLRAQLQQKIIGQSVPVSYTHLTLPTTPYV